LYQLNHLWTHHSSRVQALLSNTCCVRRTQCISLNLPLRPATVGCVFNKIWKQKLINSYVLVLSDIDNDFPNTDRLAKVTAVCARKLVYVCSAAKLHTSPSCALPISLCNYQNSVTVSIMHIHTGHVVYELILNALRHSIAVLCQILVKSGFLLWLARHNEALNPETRDQGSKP